MKLNLVFCSLLATLALSSCAERAPRADAVTAPETAPALTPPIAKRIDARIEAAHGTRIDPYAWLRDDTRTKPDVLAYLNAENAYTAQYFAPSAELQATLFNEMKARIKQDDSSVPVFENGYWYYTRFEQGGEYPIHARRKGSMQGAEQVMLDGNAMAKGLSYFLIGDYEVSDDGNTLSYAVDTVGRRQFVVRFKDLRSNAELGDSIANVNANLVWAADNRTLFYVEIEPTTLLPYRVKRHIVGTPAASDPVVYEERDNTFYTSLGRTKSDAYVTVNLSSTLTSEVRLLRADQPGAALQTFLPRERGHEYVVDHLDGKFYVLSNWQASNFRIWQSSEAVPTSKPQWRELVAHRTDALIDDFELYSGYLALDERSGGLKKIRLINLKAGGKDRVIDAPDPAYAMSLVSTPALDKLRYNYDALTTPHSTWELDLQSDQRTLLKRDPVLGDFDSANYSSEFRFATAADGAQIPVSIVYRKSTPRDGTAPLYQYGYGSYGISMEPTFSAARLSLLDRGFVYAIAHVRGGQEMGRSWYESGKLLNKKNSFTDFLSVSDFLIEQKYGAPDKLFAAGRSAGGLLMGGVINIGGEKYRGIAAHVPFVDAVSTMLDESIPLTTGEFDEWGNPKEKASYDYMLSYSPYDNVSAKAYPAMFVTTGLHDSQVQYFEPAKWVAKLRAMKTDNNPLLFKTNMEAGHGGRSGRFVRLEETAQEYAFFLGLLGK